MRYFLKHIALKLKIKEHARVVKMDKKRFEVHLYFKLYERAIILIFDLWLLISVKLLIIFTFFICIWLYCYQTTFTYLLVFAKLYGLIVKTSNC